MTRKEIAKRFAELYFDIESLLPLLENFMTDRWSELEENPRDEEILETMLETRNFLVEAVALQSSLNDRAIEEILTGMRRDYADEKKTLHNWRAKIESESPRRS